MEQYSFQEVMRQLNRMCLNHPNCGDNCGNECPIICECGNIGNYCSNAKQSMRIEKAVMSWAAEHPAPVYPTWSEWLADVGLLINNNGCYAFNFNKAFEPIPADIAKKLGIEPKEVQNGKAD